MKKTLLSCILVVTSVGANAATINFDHVLPEENIILGVTELDQTGTLGLFDSLLGTLTAVNLRLTGRFTSSVTVFNDPTLNTDLLPIDVIAESFTRLTFDESDLGVDLGIPDPAIVLTIDHGGFTVSAGEQYTFGPGQTNGEYSLDIPVLDFNAFQADGGGTFDIGCTSSLTVINWQSSDFGIVGGGDASAGCDFHVVYTFDEAVPGVPEPATLALMGLGLAGIGYRRHRSKKAA